GRSVRESIETPASRAVGSSPCPGSPATASATCVSVHRIVASIGWLSPGFGRSVHLVRKAHLCAFSPVEGSSFDLSANCFLGSQALVPLQQTRALRAKS